MRKSDEFKETISVEDLVLLQKKSAVLYSALRDVCMLRGFAELLRFTKKLTHRESGDNRKVILNASLDEAANRKLIKCVFKVINSCETATDMYRLFYLCDTVCENDVAEKKDE